MKKPEQVSPLQMYQLLRSQNLLQAIHVASALKIADRVKAGPKTIDELAAAADAKPGPLRRVLRVLTGVGIFAEDATGRISLTPAAELMLESRPGSLRDGALLVGAPFHWNVWSRLLDCVKTGRSAFEHAHGMSLYEYLAEHPDEATIYYGPTRAQRKTMMPVMLKGYEFSRFQTIADIGGGDGTFLAEVLRANPASRGMLFDLPAVVADVAPIRGEPELAARCEIIGGSFFDAWPAGADVYVLSTVLMDWDDEATLRILARARDVLGAGGHLMVILDLDTASPHDRLTDLDLLAFTPSGRLRTEAELVALFATSGLRHTRTVKSSMTLAMLEAVLATA